MSRTLLLSLAAATAVAVAAGALSPAHAVKRGQPDGDDHPMVALLSFHDDQGNALWRCSGTLVSPTVVVTAGHCTSDDDGGSVHQAQVWFDEGPIPTNRDFLDDVAAGEDASCLDEDDGDERYSGYPCTGELAGTPHTHPAYEPAQFFMHDLGVVVLDEEVELPADRTYATLPAPDAYDGWKSNHKQTFTSVGYGVQLDYGQGASWKEENLTERRVAHPRLVSINTPSLGDFAMKLSNSSKTGGTCSGDSGGPNFLEGSLELAAVTSYGGNDQTCSGPSGAYRLDRPEDLAWIGSFEG